MVTFDIDASGQIVNIKYTNCSVVSAGPLLSKILCHQEGKGSNVGSVLLENGSRHFGKGTRKAAEGLGVRISQDGRSTIGIFRKDKLQGVCKVALPQGDCFFGCMKDDYPDGEGMYMDSQTRSWTLGYFLQFQCISVLREGITGPNPSKRQIMKNYFLQTKTNERCEIKVPFVDFAKPFLEKLQPLLESIEGYTENVSQMSIFKNIGARTNKDSISNTDRVMKVRDFSAGSMETVRIGAKAPSCADDASTERIRTVRANSSSEKKGIKTLTRNLSAGKLTNSSGKKSSNHGISQQGGPFELDNEQQWPAMQMKKDVPCNPSITKQGQPTRSEDNPMVSINDVLNTNQLEKVFASQNRLGTITEHDEDFCRSKSSIRETHSRVSPRPPAGTEYTHNQDSPPKFERVPSPKPANYFEASAGRLEPENTTHLNSRVETPSEAYSSKRTNSASQVHSQRSPGSNNFILQGKSPTTVVKVSKELKATHPIRQIHHQDNQNVKGQAFSSDLSRAGEWYSEEKRRFSAALQRLHRIEYLANEVQQQVQRSRTTQVLF